MNARVLIAEDDPRQAEVLRLYLDAEGYETVVAHDGRAAVDAARRLRPDLLVLDVMMPGVDGLDVCRILRQETAMPILMLTARSNEDDLLLGLDLGADDYIGKPYSPRELMARVRTLLRRVERAVPRRDGVLRVDGLTVDPLRHEVWVDDRLVDCTAGEFTVLATLAAEPGRVFTRQQLLERTRGWDTAPTQRTIDMHIMHLRKKVERDPRRPARLLTVHGIGYKLGVPAAPRSGGDTDGPA
ncbi:MULTISPECIES: response regulator transcription factor [Streptomyces]|jgi:DNA-binding response OmpR family regulator|uniref:DNA-binding response regulator, OmpR family, contains REC and winged-helix (WHTH) domain n=2 Tax=Streptomyces griseoaurantiacus TaxID=68213 RepID=A0A1G7RB24_9ACTN|nr:MULTISPECIES: response regulator transcription factor [Streptomyces]MBA5221607.1 response regulator transcription factor [Streptomyces griseoaurantiacus]MCF0085542.1 Alkaline phosphatase synthesis transcriptional regulatory protein PhoP [Streptomyces sp. MH192]MCF0098518.1 Alkaline phosphatase synthesis transcriptional regulatory protein PhoP [Streptomyces sp. MH191]MDX3087712.1 response regulator transcription factor [Streptomyces sp. ME12-02E]MDX3331108.1 response regulator transcription 